MRRIAFIFNLDDSRGAALWAALKPGQSWSDVRLRSDAAKAVLRERKAMPIPLRPKSKRLRSMERGAASVVFGLGMIALLVAFSGYLYDVRRVALAQLRAQDTLDLAAHRAGSDIDIPRFKVFQDVILSPAAEGDAMNAIHSANTSQYNLSVNSVQYLYGGSYMQIRGEISVPLGFLARAFGVSEAKRQFTTIVEPQYGIQHKYD
jgi:hypothetical protein